MLELSDGVPIWPLGGLTSDPLGQNNSEPMDVLSLAPGCTPKNVVQPGNLQYLQAACFIYPVAPSQAFFERQLQQIQPRTGWTLGTPASLGLDPLTCTNLLGNLRRNAIIGPGLFNVDMSLIKDTHIAKFGENFNVQFRAEFFNILESHQLRRRRQTTSMVSIRYSLVTGFGQSIRPHRFPMREIQFALKIVW